VVFVALGQAGTEAEVEGDGGFCLEDLGLCASLGAQPTPPAKDRSGITRRARSRFYWLQTGLNNIRCAESPDGYQTLYQLIDRTTNEIVDTRVACIDRAAGTVSPPVPPNPDAVWDRVPLPPPEVRVNPAAGGLTGLETFFWYDQPADARLDVDLDGFVVTLDAKAVRWRWRTGDGTELTSSQPGTAEAAAASHIYETKGDYTLTIEVTWAGTYQFSGPGLVPVVVPLGERTFNGRAPFPVTEIRGVRR
jgi:hypothetical protein